MNAHIQYVESHELRMNIQELVFVAYTGILTIIGNIQVILAKGIENRRRWGPRTRCGSGVSGRRRTDWQLRLEGFLVSSLFGRLLIYQVGIVIINGNGSS